MICSPGERAHNDQPNFRIEDYIQMCRDGEVDFSVTEAARLMGVSRMHIYRMMMLAEIPDDEFEEVLNDPNVKLSLTSLADEVRRRTGRAKAHVERCPNCGHELRTRIR